MADPIPNTAVSWLTLIPALGGFFAGWLTEWFRDERARKREHETAEAIRQREREARDAARREQRFERRNSFQRQTLLDLQETLHRMLRAEGQMNHLDVMATREGLKWHDRGYPEELSNESHDANVKCMLLVVRMRNDAIRKLAEDVRTKVNSILFFNNETDSRRALSDAGELFGSLNELIGKELRQLDDDENG
jgi:hypothetical protein